VVSVELLNRSLQGRYGRSTIGEFCSCHWILSRRQAHRHRVITCYGLVLAATWLYRFIAGGMLSAITQGYGCECIAPQWFLFRPCNVVRMPRNAEFHGPACDRTRLDRFLRKVVAGRILLRGALHLAAHLTEVASGTGVAIG